VLRKIASKVFNIEIQQPDMVKDSGKIGYGNGLVERLQFWGFSKNPAYDLSKHSHNCQRKSVEAFKFSCLRGQIIGQPNNLWCASNSKKKSLLIFFLKRLRFGLDHFELYDSFSFHHTWNILKVSTPKNLNYFFDQIMFFTDKKS
jgi:hypothetical protein